MRPKSRVQRIAEATAARCGIRSSKHKERQQITRHTHTNVSVEVPTTHNVPMLNVADNPDYLDKWHSSYQQCHQFFLAQAQYERSVQQVASLINIRLPFQLSGWQKDLNTCACAPECQIHERIIPVFLRRLVVTGFDSDETLANWFSNEWKRGVKPIHQQERLNYLFISKSGGWSLAKQSYDILPDQTVPFLRPLRGATEDELRLAEGRWSEWLAMEDWMLGPRWPGFDDANI